MLLSVSPQISVHYPPPELLPLSNYLFFLDKMIDNFVRMIIFFIIHFLIVLALGFIFIIYFMTTPPHKWIGGDLRASSCSSIKLKVLSSQSKSLGFFITAHLSSCWWVSHSVIPPLAGINEPVRCSNYKTGVAIKTLTIPPPASKV